MRAVLTVCVIATLAVVYASHEDDVTEATVLISDMKKKGATEADCKDLAKTTCKEVLSEVRKDQKVINSQSSGLECDKLGQSGVTIAIRHYHKRIQQWKVSKKKIVTAKETKVAISSRSYRSLRNGKCEWVFTSTSYKKTQSLYKKAIAYERTVRGSVTESKRSVAIAKKAQRIQQEKCRCNVIKRRNTIWRTVHNAKKRSRQAKAMKKCKMMQCVLNGTKLSSSKCKGTLPKLGNKKLATKVQKMAKVCAARHKTFLERRSKEHAAKRAKKERAAKRAKKERAAKERMKRKREQSAKAKAKAKHKTKRVCSPADVKGQSFYVWTGRYCYHIVGGGVLQQDWRRNKNLCNKSSFRSSVRIGRGKGISSYYPNGDRNGCPGNRPRSASLTIKRNPHAKSMTARVSEPRTCYYKIVVTTPKCHPSRL